MNNPLKGKTAIVGVGSSEYFRRGQSVPQTPQQLALTAIQRAVDDAGLTLHDIDGFAMYSGGVDTANYAQMMGLPHVGFTAMLTGGGGGSAGSIGLAAAAVNAGMADVVVSLAVCQQTPDARLGAGRPKPINVERPSVPYPSILAGQFFAIQAQRHMHVYGTKREHFAEVAISSRNNAIRRKTALMPDELTLDEYFNARFIAEPLCLFDYCLESDGAVAVITTSAERAASLAQPPVHIMSTEHGGDGNWGFGIGTFAMPEETWLTTGQREIARRLYGRAGITPDDVDVALLYDHFTPGVLLQLEDYGFCAPGESGPFVEAGNIRWPNGPIPVNTHGGNLSEAYIYGFTHVREAVEQLRGTATNQVDGAEIALVTGGPGMIPCSGLLLHR